MISKRKKLARIWLHHIEFLVAAIILCSLVLFIALYSYDSHDSSFFHVRSTISIHNWCGPLGAQIAALLWFLCGGASYLIVVALMMIAYIIIKQRSIYDDWERLLAMSGIITAVAGLCSLHRIDFPQAIVPGGYLGLIVARFSMRFLDYIGSLIMLMTLLEVCAIIVIRFSFMRLLLASIAYAHNVSSRIIKSRVIQRGVVVTMQGMIQLCKSLYSATQAFISGNFFEGTSLMEPEDIVACGCEQVLPVDDYQEQRATSLSDQSHVLHESKHVMSGEQVESHDNASDAQNESVIDAYLLPDLDIFVAQNVERIDNSLKKELQDRAKILEEKLMRFGVKGNVSAIKRGPVVTLFEYQPDIDTKISKILALEDDLALALQALSIRIIAPIPGRSVVGFEVANNHRKDVLFSRAVKSSAYAEHDAQLPLILGEDTMGTTVVIDLAKMPHLLVAGSTGSGKSAALNTMLMSLLCACLPDRLKLILIDPKRLEFAPFADIAHLLFPIVTDPKKAVPVLRWVVQQMEQRYEQMSQCGAKNIQDFNAQASHKDQLSYIVVVIDELSDLMMTAGRDIEDLITRITQMARAAGIHLIVATQRPSVDVITGLIKVNFPSRISFRVTSKIDSRTIIDCAGADKLLGKGDMLFLDSHSAQLRRIHGAYVSSKEIQQVISHIRSQRAVVYLDINEELKMCADNREGDEPIYDDVLAFLKQVDDISISLLQRKFKIGYNRSARIIEMLEQKGIILPSSGGKTRKVIK